MRLELRDDLADAWRGEDPFRRAAIQQGEIFREKDDRRTLRFCHDGHCWFLKYHRGVGWGEILKNLSRFKAPVLGAAQEKRAIEAVAAAGLDTMTVAGFGERGLSPASRESFLVTDEIGDSTSLEDVCEAWPANPPGIRFRNEVIDRVASIARRMHDAGVNHRDFYLCHFLALHDDIDRQTLDGPLWLIDLHRSQIRRHVPRRWRVKDLGGLYFSTARSGVRKRDILRFIRVYSGLPLKQALAEQGGFWRAVRRDAERIYRRYYRKEPRFPLQFSEHPGRPI